MPTNANTFNSRVTSEALEAKFRQVFPSQGGAELVQDLFASGVIQPVVDFSTVAEGSFLPEYLQTAWDFSTGSVTFNSNSSGTVLNNTGFWVIDVSCGFEARSTITEDIAKFTLTDGLTSKLIWCAPMATGGSLSETGISVVEQRFVVFVNTGESITYTSSVSPSRTVVWYRQVADINGNLVNPLGFTFS